MAEVEPAALLLLPLAEKRCDSARRRCRATSLASSAGADVSSGSGRGAEADGLAAESALAGGGREDCGRPAC